MPPFPPFKSKAQEGLFNSNARPKGVTPEDVAGMNAASKGMKLPDHVPSKKKKKKVGRRPTMMLNSRHFAPPLPQNPMPGGMPNG